MKIRSGFVSNSSASSFCIVGIGCWGTGRKVMRQILDMIGATEDALEDQWDWLETNMGDWGHGQ